MFLFNNWSPDQIDGTSEISEISVKAIFDVMAGELNGSMGN